MRVLYYLTIFTFFLFPFFVKAESANLFVTLTKFDSLTLRGGDNHPDQKNLIIEWNLESSIPRKLATDIQLINVSNNTKTPIINACTSFGLNNECQLSNPENYQLVDPVGTRSWMWPIPNDLPSGNYKVLLRVIDRNTGLEEARSESNSTINIISSNGNIDTINNPLVLASYNPQIVYFNQTQDPGDTGSIKIEWRATDTNKINFVLTGPNFGSISGLNIKNAKTGEDFPLSTQFFNSEGYINLKITNATSFPKIIWAVADPQSNIPEGTLKGRKILEINIPGSSISPKIKSISPSVIHIGDNVTISGSGFAKTDNSVGFESAQAGLSGIVQWNISSSDGNTLRFIVPGTMKQMSEKAGAEGNVDVVPGKYQVSVSNDYGKSESYYFNVSEEAHSVPASADSNIQTNKTVAPEPKKASEEPKQNINQKVEVKTEVKDKQVIGDQTLTTKVDDDTKTPDVPVSKPSVFTKIWDFFFGWLK